MNGCDPRSSVTPSSFERGYRMDLEDRLEFSQDVIAYAQGLTLAAWRLGGLAG